MQFTEQISREKNYKNFGNVSNTPCTMVEKVVY